MPTGNLQVRNKEYYPEKGLLVGDPLMPYVPSGSKPWNARRVAHLYRRLGYGATYAQIQQGLQLSPSELVDQLLDTAANLGTPNPPYWAAYTTADYNGNTDLFFQHRDELRQRWSTEMLEEGIRSKMAFFWHNHFVTELDVYDCNNYMWDYYSLIHQYAFGNFRVFTREMGRNAAMLVYLNGNLNVADEPNENYARELMELFTMGESNGYTQADIVEMARALTGWQANMYECEPAFYNPTLHDNNNKVIFGKTDNYTFTTAHNLIFVERAEQVSRYITGKLYQHFVYQQIDPQVIEGLALTFKTGNWELLPVLKQLLKSEHFFEDHFINCRLKNPLETMIPIWRSGGIVPADTNLDWINAVGYWAYELGQEIFNPPNVAGWKGHRVWINESTLTARWNYSAFSSYIFADVDTAREKIRALALELTNESNNPVVIAQAMIEHFMGIDLEPVHLQSAVIYLKAGIPENYYQDGSWNLYWNEAPDQLVNLLFYLVRLPEFQLT